ncbi:MAG: hypothetical protein Q8O89_02835 [Nanoarchaeota archaeon]|nr:hypothetical protein [Nanoarchaeota archaeon]
MIAILFTTILTSSAQILWKLGTQTIDTKNVSTIIFNPHIIGGFCIYGIGAFILISALKRGELSVLYPIIAMSYVWVALAVPFFIGNDSMNSLKWIGIAFIVLGVSCIGIGSQIAEKRQMQTHAHRGKK